MITFSPLKTSPRCASPSTSPIASHSENENRSFPSTFTVEAVKHIATQLNLASSCIRSEFNTCCRNIKHLLQHLDSVPKSDLSSKTQLSSDLVDVTEYALTSYPFSDTDEVRWDVSRLRGQSLRDLAELIAAVDQYIELQGDFVLQLRMAIIAKMIEDQSFAARSPGDTSPVHSNADSTPPTANETATSSSSTLALSVPDPLPPLLHPADCIPATHNFLGHSTLALEADPCPELSACLPDLVPSSTPNTDPVINRGSSPSFDIPSLTTGLPLSAIDADHWSFLCSKDDADGTFETPTTDMEHTLLWTPGLATCQLLLSETLIMRSNSPPADDASLWTPSIETSEFPLSEALSMSLDQSNSSLMDESYSLTPAASWSSSLASCNSTQSLPATPAAQSQTRASSEKENCWGRVHSTDTELKDPESPTKKHDVLEHATEEEYSAMFKPATRSCSTDKQRRVVEDYLGGNFP